MRLNEFRVPQDEIFEDSDVDTVLDLAIEGDAAFSKPMSAEEAIALTLGKTNQ
jgi:hypothetical protein